MILKEKACFTYHSPLFSNPVVLKFEPASAASGRPMKNTGGWAPSSELLVQ